MTGSHRLARISGPDVLPLASTTSVVGRARRGPSLAHCIPDPR
jgi:hypothetical protein